MQYGKYRTRIRRLTELGSEGHYHPGHQGHKLRRSDVGPHRPASLAPTQEMTDFTAEFVARRRDDRPHIHSGIGQSVHEIALGGDLGDQIVHEFEESCARLGRVAQDPSVVDQLLQPVMDHRLDKRLLRREVAIERPRAHGGPAGNFIQRDGDSLGGEGGGRDLDEPVMVPAGVGSHRSLRQELLLSRVDKRGAISGNIRGVVSDYSPATRHTEVGAPRADRPQPTVGTVERLLQAPVSPTPGDTTDLYGDRVILTERYRPGKARFSGKRNGDGDGP